MWACAISICWLGAVGGCQSKERPGVCRYLYSSADRHLVVEVLDDDLVHFELSEGTSNTFDPKQRVWTTPMVSKTDHPGPTWIRDNDEHGIETTDMRVVVEPHSLAVTVIDKTATREMELTTIRPDRRRLGGQRLIIAPNAMRHVYGLGEQFITPGDANGDWLGRVRTPGCEFGNQIVLFEEKKGNVGNAQFPIMYAVGETEGNYALFVDHVPAQTWDFTGDHWTLDTSGDPVRWYVMTGPDLPDLRRDYMELVGRPPVPPKKMFGLWVSEFGYDDWAELDDKLATLRANKFPVDGFVLDLQWFGGVAPTPEGDGMGSLTWDADHFPDSAGKIAQLATEHGIGLMVIEESYVSRGLPEHAMLAERGYLVRDGSGHGDSSEGENPSSSGGTPNATAELEAPMHLSAWWGKGGMVDWTNSAAADSWHDLKRQPLIEDGILGHWTDLGEPEAFDPDGRYHGFPEFAQHDQRSVHNIYNFRWAQSIHRGYARHGVERRPFIMSRSGTSGIQRFGASMWSGDIGSRLCQLRTHFNAQMHMSFSGVDYFGADIGGFQRWSNEGDLDEMYTQWFANGAAFDVPVRPHTANTKNKHETAPDRIGNLASNLANIRLRYELSPYLYSLAHLAYLYGEPVMPPPVFYYQHDPNVREMGGQKMLGRDLLVAAVAEHGKTETDVYLPAGTWINYHTNEWIESRGEWVSDVPLYIDGIFRLPMFARAGAIIPLMHVDEMTMNIMGQRTDGSRRDEVIVRVYAHDVRGMSGSNIVDGMSQFTLIEDDGETIAYQNGAVRQTVVVQAVRDRRAGVIIDLATGSYAGAPDRRENVVQLVTHRLGPARAVDLNDKPLQRHDSREAFDAASDGWFQAGPNLVIAKSGRTAVSEPKLFGFDFERDENPNPPKRARTADSE